MTTTTTYDSHSTTRFEEDLETTDDIGTPTNLASAGHSGGNTWCGTRGHDRELDDSPDGTRMCDDWSKPKSYRTDPQAGLHNLVAPPHSVVGEAGRVTRGLLLFVDFSFGVGAVPKTVSPYADKKDCRLSQNLILLLLTQIKGQFCDCELLNISGPKELTPTCNQSVPL